MCSTRIDQRIITLLTIIIIISISSTPAISSPIKGDQQYELIKTIDPPEPHYQGFFGINIAMSQNRIVVGEDGASLAHIYDRDGVLIKTLKPPTGDEKTHFGYSISIFRDQIVIGEPDAPVNGLESSGQIHLYDAAGNLLKTMHSPQPQQGGRFGSSLATDGDTLVVGEPGVFGGDGNTTSRVYLVDAKGKFIHIFDRPQVRVGSYGWSVGIRGDVLVVSEPYVGYSTESGYTHGVVHIYNVSESRLIMTLKSPRGSGFGNFGNSVYLGDDVLVVGEVRADANSTMMAGTAHIYSLDGTLIKTLYPVEPRQYGYFGIRVFVSESYVAVTQRGYVYLYDHHGTPAYTVSENILTSAYFGYDVAMEGDVLAAGVNLASVGGKESAGEVYLYRIKLPESEQGNGSLQIGLLLASFMILLVIALTVLKYLNRNRMSHLVAS